MESHLGTILIVDDDESLLLILKEFLTGLGYVVFGARTGGQAMEIARTQSPDAILLDILLPGQSGFAVLRRLRTDPETRTIPVVLASGLLTSSSHQSAGELLGAEAYLVKPYDLKQVGSLLARIISGGGG